MRALALDVLADPGGFPVCVLRAPASVLELKGVLPLAGPTWYVVFQAVLGLFQSGIGLLMLDAYRRAGVRGGTGRPRETPLHADVG